MKYALKIHSSKRILYQKDPVPMVQCAPKRPGPNGTNGTNGTCYSTVTDFAKFLGLSTSNPFSLETKYPKSCKGTIVTIEER